MRFFTLATLAISLLPSALALDPNDVCPGLFIPIPVGNQCQCKFFGLTSPFKSGCSATVVGSGLFKWCQGQCTGPSGVPKKTKRNMFYLEDGSVAPCPRGTVSCPIGALHTQPKTRARTNGRHQDTPTHVRKVDPFKDQYECIDPKYDLDNCGGCSISGGGKSCLSIPGVRGTACMEGKCAIFSCSSGYTLVATKSETNDDITHSCVANEM